MMPAFFAVGQVEVGKAQLDGDTAFLFFLDAIGFDAGQCLDQGSFAVVNVSGGTDDDIFSCAWLLCEKLPFAGQGRVRKNYLEQQSRMLWAT